MKSRGRIFQRSRCPKIHKLLLQHQPWWHLRETLTRVNRWFRLGPRMTKAFKLLEQYFYFFFEREREWPNYQNNDSKQNISQNFQQKRCLIYFWPMFPFYTTWKHQTTKHWPEMEKFIEKLNIKCRWLSD